MAIDLRDALSGALGGAGAGATLGSTFLPGIGTGVGALGGGLLGALASLLSGGGKQGGLQRTEALNPQEQGILSLLLQLGAQQYQNPYQGFEPIEEYAGTQFKQNILPSIAERFTSLGGPRSENAISSPAFASQVGQAYAGVDQGLNALKAQYGLQNRNQALQTLQLGLRPGLSPYYQQRQPGFGENILTGLLEQAPQIYQSYQLNNALRGLRG